MPQPSADSSEPPVTIAPCQESYYPNSSESLAVKGFLFPIFVGVLAALIQHLCGLNLRRKSPVKIPIALFSYFCGVLVLTLGDSSPKKGLLNRLISSCACPQTMGSYNFDLCQGWSQGKPFKTPILEGGDSFSKMPKSAQEAILQTLSLHPLGKVSPMDRQRLVDSHKAARDYLAVKDFERALTALQVVHEIVPGGIAGSKKLEAYALSHRTTQPLPLAPPTQTGGVQTSNQTPIPSPGLGPSQWSGAGWVTMAEVTGCESQPPVLVCPQGYSIKAGVIRYGRWDTSSCPPNPPVAPRFQEFSSLPVGTQNQNRYNFGPLNQTLGADPYPGVLKQYSVRFACGK